MRYPDVGATRISVQLVLTRPMAWRPILHLGDYPLRIHRSRAANGQSSLALGFRTRRWRVAPLVTGVLAALACLSCTREPCRHLLRTGDGRDRELRLVTNNFEPQPRCRPDEPGCGPEPLRHAKDGCYRPSSTRVRLSPRWPDEPHSSSKYACKHDGECNLNGCGNKCTNYRIPQFATNCIGYDWLDEAQFCGCIQGECAFFRQ
jgi:hypothetical protein